MICPAVGAGVPAIAVLLNHWIETTAAIEDDARMQGAQQMITGVSAKNAEAPAFHDRPGQRIIATVPQAGYTFGRFIKLVLLQKFL